MKFFLPILGFSLWAGIAGWLGILLFGDAGTEGRPGSRERWDNLARFAFEEPLPIRIEFSDPTASRRGDLLYESRDGELIAVGEVVEALPRPQRAKTIRALVYPRSAATLTEGAKITHFTATRTASWAIATLLPKDRIETITEDVRSTFLKEKDLVVDLLRPHLRYSADAVLATLQRELPRVYEKHRDQIDSILARHRIELVEGQLLPLVREDIWPIVRTDSVPLLRKIGRKLWNRFPKWALGLRWAFQQLPGVDDDMVAERFNLFVREQGVPILLAHTDEAVEITRQTLRKISNHPKVARVVERSVEKVLGDPELEELLGTFVADLTYENEELQRVLTESWEDEDFQTALATVLGKFDDLLTRTVKSILLNEEQDGINPDLARVLRTKVLDKDRSWFLLEKEDDVSGIDGEVPGLNPRRVASGHVFRGEVYTPPW